MKHDFVKLAMAGLLAGFCVSATAASSAPSDEAAQAAQEIAMTQAEQVQAGQEIAMAKCSKDATQQDDNSQSDCSNNGGQCKQQTSATDIQQVQRKSAAQKAMGE
jgi:hypothetical protein